MCGAGLLGWEGRGPGTHNYSWQGHVHRYSIQGEHTQQYNFKKTFLSSCFKCYFMMYACPLEVKGWYCILHGYFWFFLTLSFMFLFSSHRMLSKQLRRQHLSHQTTLLFYPLKITAGTRVVSKGLMHKDCFFLDVLHAFMFHIFITETQYAVCVCLHVCYLVNLSSTRWPSTARRSSVTSSSNSLWRTRL